MSNEPKQEAPSLMGHMCRLDFTRDSKHRCMLGVICTIGPSSRKVGIIYEMIKAGMTIARINFSHENMEDHQLSVDCVRQAAQQVSKEQGYNCHIAIAGDLKGRQIRTGHLLSNKAVEIKAGDIVKLSINRDLYNKCTREVIFVDYANIIKDVDLKQRIFINDNDIELEVIEVGVDCLACHAIRGGRLGNTMGVVLPGVHIGLPVVSEKDADDIRFCIDNNIDLFFLSKLRTAEEVEIMRSKIGEKARNIKLITKLENTQALENLDSILAVSDGVLIARADMSTELKVEKIFLAQKAVIARCNRLGKIAICGTQLLMSMNQNAVPTRSDISDIATALLDGADCLLLSSETAIGEYPVETVKTLTYACREAEAAFWHRKLFKDLMIRSPGAVDGVHSIVISAVIASINVMARAIVVITISGRSAHLVSAYRPQCPIFAVTRCSRVARQMNFSRGVIPILVPVPRFEEYHKDIDERINYALTIANRMDMVQSGDAIVVLSPRRSSYGYTNNVHVVFASFEKEGVDYLRDKSVITLDRTQTRGLTRN